MQRCALSLTYTCLQYPFRFTYISFLLFLTGEFSLREDYFKGLCFTHESRRFSGSMSCLDTGVT
jgi:hypothetical protein